MRIISGKYKGRTIKTIATESLRPTMSVAREAIFNILSHGSFENFLNDCKVLDLFCGCATLAVESLSRGAALAVCIDIKNEHLNIARENIAITEEKNNCHFVKADATNLPQAMIKCNLVFIDAPYKQNLSVPALIDANKKGWLAENAIIIMETSAREDIKLPEGFTAIDTRKYSNSRIHIVRKD